MILSEIDCSTQPIHHKIYTNRRAPAQSEMPSDVALGNIANNASNLSSTHKRRSDAYRLLAHAQTLLIDHDIQSKRGNSHRARMCLGARQGGEKSIVIRLSGDAKNSSASIGNVQTCSSVWACPVCAARIAVQRGKELQKALDWCNENAHMPIMVSLTAQHHSGMTLSSLQMGFKRAWRSFSSGRAWRNLLNRYQIKHWVANREAPHGDNGWHYHMHLLLFLPKLSVASDPGCEQLETDLREKWLKCLFKADLEGIGEYALKVSSHGNVPERYLAKLGLDADGSVTDLRYEMSGSANKTSSGLSVWALLRKSANGNAQATNLYLEYVQSMQGERWITWSRGFKALVGVDDVSDQEASADDSNELELLQDWMSITDDEYRPVRLLKQYKALADVAAASRKTSSVRAFLELLAYELEVRQRQCLPAVKAEIKGIHEDLARWRANLHFSRYHVKDEALKSRYIDDFTSAIRAAKRRLERLDQDISR